MNEDKVCLGQAYIYKNQLIQETITFKSSGEVLNGTNVIIEDILTNLRGGAGGEGQYKVSNGRYFYWEYNQTNDEGVDIPIKFEAPAPEVDIFFKTTDVNVIKENLEKGDYDSSEYSKYWANKIVEANNNYNERYAIQKKEIKFAETHRISYDNSDGGANLGKPVIDEAYSVPNNDLAFIENLISTIF